MSTRRTADVVFCIDASGSMEPCFAAMQTHIGSFIEGLHGDRQSAWDLRFDFLAYAAGNDHGENAVFDFRSIRQQGAGLVSGLCGNQGSDAFFTRDLGEFKAALSSVRVGGDEATFIAIDTALHFPWRDMAACHRILVVLTDEALETGVLLRAQMEALPRLIEKIHDLHIMLFLVGPSSIAYDQLSAADKSEYCVADQAHDGLATVDFSKILETIGKSVSTSVLQRTGSARVPAPLFGQDSWAHTSVNRLSGH